MSSENVEAGRRRPGRVIAVVLLLILIVVIAGIAGAYMLNSAPSRELSGPVSFTIEPGETLGTIADRLERLGIIRSGTALSVIARFQGTERSVQSGNYRFDERMTALDMHDYLLSGNQVLKKVTVPEGLTLSRVGEILSTAGITDQAEFDRYARDPSLASALGIPGDTVEGFLFPDTYLFVEDYPAEDVIRHMVARFFGVLDEINAGYGDMPASKLYEAVILASIVEREYRVPEEAATIASVFYNRLDINMRLESCATVVYVMTEIEGLPHPQRLFYRDLERANPYNTYRTGGLPPGPIANPGRTALEAAFFPEITDYRFFVWNGPGSGSHAFTRTLSEHNDARLLYLKSP